MTVKKIVSNWLKKHGYDGLYNSFTECGCLIEELMPCDYSCDDCKPGYKNSDPSGESNWLVGPKKGKK